MKRYTVTALATVEISIEVDANSPVEALVVAEGRRNDFEVAVEDNHGTLINIELSGAKALA